VVCEIAALAILPLLGTARKPAFKCKAAESRDMIGFTAAALHKACENPDASRTLKHLRDSADYLVGVYKILTLKEVTLSTETCDLFEACTLSFIASWKKAKCGTTMKHHYATHLATQVRQFGNASYFHTYADERFNRIVKRMAATSHNADFASTVLIKAKKTRR
jgi:hypothetical protein